MRTTPKASKWAPPGHLAALPIVLSSVLALGPAFPGSAAAQQTAPDARAAEQIKEQEARQAAVAALQNEAARMQAEARRTAAYLAALESAEHDQEAALVAMKAAREELTVRAEAEQAALAAAGRDREAMAALETRELERQQEQELKSVQKELERAHENLRKASREVARVHRELFSERAEATSIEIITGNRAVIGVIPGANTDEGVRLDGISPGGPAEQAGLQQGDVISAIMGEPLADGGTNSRLLLTRTMADVNPGDELVLTILRGDEELEVTLVAEERSPLSWQSVTRLASAPRPPHTPGAPPPPPGQAPDQGRFPATDGTIVVQSIEVPEFDLGELETEIETLREALGEQNILIERIEGDGFDDTMHFEFETLSDAGINALSGANIWFGTRLTRGLKLASLDDELGRYFAASAGVLVLAAPEQNALQLRGGDVILSIDRSTVEQPADVMRALRNADPGELLLIDIMRDQQAQTMEVSIPENTLGLLFPHR